MRSATRKPEPKLVAAIAPFCENSPPRRSRGAVLCLQVNLDAEFVLANLDAARRNTSPSVKQGIASDRDLPGCNAMFANELMYITFESKFLSVHPSFP